jgi:hypothetical protein
MIMLKERIRVLGWSSAAMLIGLAAGRVWAQPPSIASGQPDEAYNRGGPIHRMLHHSGRELKDKFIGYPETFIEPPLGYYVREQFSIQVAKADPHRFTLYKSDFLPGTDRFSPAGAARFNLMYSKLSGWVGPIMVEWTPDQPGLAESRRQIVLATLNRAGRPIVADRVVIGPSPYPGRWGIEAGNDFNNIITRSQMPAQNYTLSPTNISGGIQQ